LQLNHHSKRRRTALLKASVTLGLLAVAALAGGRPCRGDNLPETGAGTKGAVWRSARNCGLNCLYILLGAHNIETDYNCLSEEVLVEDKGSSLTDLRLAAKRHGLAATLGKTGPEGLTGLPKPVVAHWDLANQPGDNPGHFVLVLKTTAESVEFMDGTSGTIGALEWREFQRRWSGYVLYVSPSQPFASWGYLAGAVVAGVLAGALVHRFLAPRAVGRASHQPQLQGEQT
jgi:hypothetical protein